MRLSLFLLFALPLPPALAQEGIDTAWRGGGPSSDVGDAVAVGGEVGDFRIAVVGTFEGTATFGTHQVTSAGQSDAFVVLYDQMGDALWARRMGTNVFNDFGGGAAIGPDGAVYVSGYFTGIATFDGGNNPDTTLTTRNDFDAFLARYSAAGDLEWVQHLGGPGQDTGRGVTTDASGTAYVTGSFAQAGVFGDTTLTSAGNSDAFLAAFAPGGALAWALRAGGTDSDDGRDVVVDASGSVYVVGTFRGVALFGSTPIQSRGASDLFVVRYQQDGTAQWVEQIGGGGFDYGRGITLHYEHVVVTGSFEGTILIGTDILTSAGNSDVVVGFVSMGGALGRGFRAGGPGFDIGNDVSFDGLRVRGTGYIEGAVTYEDDGGTHTATAQGIDGFALGVGLGIGNGLDATLLPLGGPNADRGYGVASIPNGNLLTAYTGAFRETADFVGFSLTSAGSNDVYVAAAIDCGACPANEPGADGAPALVSLASANPARDGVVLSLAMDRPQFARAEVFDGLGRRVALAHEGALAAGTHRLVLDTRAWPAGTYLVRVQVGLSGEAETARFTVVR